MTPSPFSFMYNDARRRRSGRNGRKESSGRVRGHTESQFPHSEHISHREINHHVEVMEQNKKDIQKFMRDITILRLQERRRPVQFNIDRRLYDSETAVLCAAKRGHSSVQAMRTIRQSVGRLDPYGTRARKILKVWPQFEDHEEWLEASKTIVEFLCWPSPPDQRVYSYASQVSLS